jgi:hypothetical protein
MNSGSRIAFQPAGQATGIGSLPFTDPHTALALICAHLPDIPHWPQLPQRGRQEHFIHQFLQPLVDCGLLCVNQEPPYLDTSAQAMADHLTAFYHLCLAAEAGDNTAINQFMPPREAAIGLYLFLETIGAGTLNTKGYVKGQIAGPLTVGLGLNDHQGRPAYYHGDLRDVIVRTLSLAAHCQTAALQQTGCVPIVFVDDPAISAWGSRLHLALDRTTIQEDLAMIFSSIRSCGGIPGFHACQAVDWSLALASGADILSLDAFRFGRSLLTYVDDMSRFLNSGGIIAWGIVPTLDDPFAVTVESLLDRLNALWELLFCGKTDRDTVVRQSMITPACGVGLLTPDQARCIYQLTAGVSRRLGDTSSGGG